jgi:hypothetical protein
MKDKENNKTSLEIEEIKLESETIHKSMIEVWLQQHTEIDFGPHHGLAAIRKADHGQYEIVKSYVEVVEKE